MILRDIFKARSSAEWIAFGNEHNTPIAPVNTPRTIADDPQFQHRLPWYGRDDHGAEMLPFPVKFIDEQLPEPARAPTLGQQSDEVLKGVLGYDDEKIARLRSAGALG